MRVVSGLQYTELCRIVRINYICEVKSTSVWEIFPVVQCRIFMFPSAIEKPKDLKHETVSSCFVSYGYTPSPLTLWEERGWAWGWVRTKCWGE
jgi:hypothetical protein